MRFYAATCLNNFQLHHDNYKLRNSVNFTSYDWDFASSRDRLPFIFLFPPENGRFLQAGNLGDVVKKYVFCAYFQEHILLTSFPTDADWLACMT